MKLRSCAPAFLLAALLAFFLPASAQTTREFTLDNGLRILVREAHQAPVVSVMVWYKVGSIDEPAGATGISHVLEHMMFKGSKHLQPGEFSSLVSRFGGDENAMTGYDYTAYYQSYAANRLPLALELEAERMHNLVIDPQEFASEVKVVKEERRMRTEDNPNARAGERIAAVERPGTGFAHPVIGTWQDLDALTPAMLERWYRLYYQPSNAILIVVGNVQADAVLRLAKRYFGGIKNGATPWHATTGLEPAAGERRITLRVPVKLPSVDIAWNVPTQGNVEKPEDYYALMMLAGVLDGGTSARLETRLVRDRKLAAGVSADFSGIGRGGGLFSLSATPNPGVSLAQMEQALRAEVAALAKTPPGADEMQRVRAQVLASETFKKESNLGQAMSLGWVMTSGLPWQAADELAGGLGKITPEQVSAVARTWLVPERETTAWTLPTDGEEN